MSGPGSYTALPASAHISGWGSYVPERVLSNADLERLVDTSDDWIRSRVAALPPERRKLVSDHAEFGYFAHAYGFEQSGTIVASFSTSAAPSAQELAALEDLIRAQGVPAVFISSDVSPVLADQIVADTGVRLVTLYTHSLSAPDGPAACYLDLMRYNVDAIVSALRAP